MRTWHIHSVFLRKKEEKYEIRNELKFDRNSLCKRDQSVHQFILFKLWITK